MIIEGVCQYHHDPELRELRRLTQNRGIEEMEDYEVILPRYEDNNLDRRMLRFYPDRPSDQEIENELREITKF